MDVFIARQPIFNKKNKVIAYELLFRSSMNNSYHSHDGDKATLDLINSISTIGIDNVLSGKKAFINFTDNLIKEGIPAIITPNILTVEILEDIEPTPDILFECRKLKSLGYTIALDDFVFHPKYYELIKLADIIKVDFRKTLGHERKDIIDKINSKNIKFLAEKVEDIKEFDQAAEYGYSYFQGYYFSKPIILKGKGIPSSKIISFKILHELSKEDVDIKNLKGLILQDVSISYKLLRYINSSIYGFKNKITSIDHAIVLLGEKELVKWLYIIIIKDMGEDKNDELINNSLIRAKFCELLCIKCGDISNSINTYIMGMLSLIDAILNRPLIEIIKELYLPINVSDALLGKNNYYRSILNLVISYEKVDWDEVINYSKRLSLSGKIIANIYMEALKWVKDFNLEA